MLYQLSLGIVARRGKCTDQRYTTAFELLYPRPTTYLSERPDAEVCPLASPALPAAMTNFRGVTVRYLICNAEVTGRGGKERITLSR